MAHRDSSRPTSSDRGADTALLSPTFEESEVVYILDPRPDLGLKRGDHGTVVHAYSGTSEPAYIVEFVNPTNGSTRALTEFTADQLSRTPPTC